MEVPNNIAPDDTVVHHTEGYFGYWDCIKLLLGRKIIINIQIDIWKQEIGVAARSKSQTISVERFIKNRPVRYGGYEISTEPIEEENLK